MKTTWLFFKAIALIVMLAGCASGAREASMVVTEVSGAPTVASAAFNVRDVTGGSETNPLLWSTVSDGAFKAALIESMMALDVFDANSPFELRVAITDLRQPFLGLNLTVGFAAEYTVTDSTGTQLFATVVDENYTAAFTDHLIASERLRLANEGAAKANIQVFIERLLTVEMPVNN